MTAPAEPTRRFTLALTAAVAATTVAVGVTVATLLGWFRPAAPPEPAVAYVPITPAVEQPRVASDVSRRHEPREHEHDDREDDDDE